MEVELIQRSEEWLEFRKNRIGASDAPVIMGVSPWKTPYELWQEKMGFLKTHETPAMRYGNEMEEVARHSYNRVKRDMYVPCVFVSDKYPWMIASMDGMTFDRKSGVEIKCPGKRDQEIAKAGKVPEHYYAQLQHQMSVCDLDQIDYYSFDGNEGLLITVKKDDGYITSLIEKEQEFYDCLINFKEPELTDRDYTQRYDPEWEDTATRWIAVRDVMDSLKKEEDELREKLISLSGGLNAKGSGVKLKSYFKLGAIDYRSIPELSQVDLERYRKNPSICHRLSKTQHKEL